MNSDEVVIMSMELATGSTLASSAFGAGVNEALADQAAQVVEQLEELAQMRKWAARVASTDSSAFDMEKFTVQSYTNGGDISDGAEPTYTVIDNQSLIQFTDAAANSIQVGVKLTPKLLRQARQDPGAFLRRYRDGLARNVAVKEDTYIASVLCASPESDSVKVVYGGSATSIGLLQDGDTLTNAKVEDMVDEFKEQSENLPTDLILPTRMSRQLRDDSRLLNSSTYSLALREDGSHVVMFGDVEVHEVKGTTILPFQDTGAGSSVDYGCAILLNRSAAYGIVDFEPVRFFVGEPDPTIAGTNFHRMLVTERLEAKILDEEQIVIGRFAKE